MRAPEHGLIETFSSSDADALDVDVGFQRTLGVALRARAFGPRIDGWRIDGWRRVASNPPR